VHPYVSIVVLDSLTESLTISMLVQIEIRHLFRLITSMSVFDILMLIRMIDQFDAKLAERQTLNSPSPELQ
jgi:hypothetical protein